MGDVRLVFGACVIFFFWGGEKGQRWQYPTKIFKLHFLSSKTSQLGGCNEPFSR